jgi:hypothetical protein
LISRENSHIFNAPLALFLFIFRREYSGEGKDFAVIPTLEGELLHKKLITNYFK